MLNKVINLKIDNMKWNTFRLGEIAEEISERVDHPSESDLKKFVGLQNFISGDLNVKNFESTENLTSAAKSFKAGDILFARRNAYLKRASLVNFDGVCSGDAFVLRENHELIEPGFLAFIVNSPALWTYANSNAEGTMSKRVKWRDLAAFEVKLPPIEEQKRISDLLWSKNTNLEMLESLLSKALVARKAYFQAKISSDECVRNKWHSEKLKNFASIVRGSSPRPAGSPELFNGSFLPWVTVGSLTKNTSPFLLKDQVKSCLTEKGAQQTRIIPPNTVLLSNSGYSLGVPRILTFEAGANDGVAAFLELEGLQKEYLYYFLDSITDHLRNRIAAGADQPNLNTTRIGNLEIPVLPIYIQEEIVREMLSFDETINSIIVSLKSGREVLIEMLKHIFSK
ncbi:MULTISPECIES: restriction endonuclease subunit S [unclassified Psychrobacter]|uniref:Restriction endonuclease subunit S n=2 Tax=Psychrobacter TaxID=497 RepID=A0ABW8L542_9GAMM|nr:MULTISPECIES: restriction endonuclease subunit S [unclassified Psychrobacter]